MPKNYYSRREDLICGKLDKLHDLVITADIPEDTAIELVDLVNDIRFDAERMEQKLILRKQEAGEK